jgi:hypothetical protein
MVVRVTAHFIPAHGFFPAAACARRPVCASWDLRAERSDTVQPSLIRNAKVPCAAVLKM